MLPYQPVYHSTADRYGRKRCAHSFANKGQAAKKVAKNRKARRLRKQQRKGRS